MELLITSKIEILIDLHYKVIRRDEYFLTNIFKEIYKKDFEEVFLTLDIFYLRQEDKSL